MSEYSVQVQANHLSPSGAKYLGKGVASDKQGQVVDSQHNNGISRTPSPRLRLHSGSTSPLSRSPSPPLFGGEGESCSGVSDSGVDVKERKPKSVSFHSNTNWKSERKTQTGKKDLFLGYYENIPASDCLACMKEGCSIIKVRSNGRQYHRYFSLLEDCSAIHWTPSSKKTAKAMVLISQIHEIRTGRNCESLRHHTHPLRFPEERIFSILYGPAYQSLDLIAPSPEEANIWVTGLNALIGDANSPCDSTSNSQPPLRDKWLDDVFTAECGTEATTLNEEKTVALLQRLEPTVETERVVHKLQELDLCKPEGCRGKTSKSEFVEMFKEVATRHEISCLLIRHTNKEYFTTEDLHVFLEGEQGRAGLTSSDINTLINLYEPNEGARILGQLHVDGFTRYLLSDECDIFSPKHREVCQDMTQPLTHYFISSSHNTYLLEDQLKGPSSVDGYIRVLTCGCRCVKVDVHDGKTEPIVFHGNTLTSQIPFREVVNAIAVYSFDFSNYPVIVHIENHCSLIQQKIMVQLLKNILGDLLYIPKKEENVCSLSPHQLKNKIILKGKKLEDEDLTDGEVSEEDEGSRGGGAEVRQSDSTPHCQGQKKTNNTTKMRLWSGLSKLIAISRRRMCDAEDSGAACQSLSESNALRLSQTTAEEMVRKNKSLLTRVFPNSSRVDSSNYNPQDFWNAGCQLVSLNFQTPGQMMDVYEGKFRCNGGSGYVLKPAVMREHISVFSTNEQIPGVCSQTLKIKIISAQSLPKPRGSTASKASFLDPYVVMQVFGIPADCKEFQSRTVRNNSRYPVFDESFDVELQLPELAVIRFVVLDDEYIGDDFIGQCTVPVSCIQSGYRHVRLLSCMGEPMDNVTLFVHIAVANKACVKPHKNKVAKKSHKSELKNVGIKQADELFKDCYGPLSSAKAIMSSLDGAWIELQAECGLELTANMKQCLKVVMTRFLTHQNNYSLSVVDQDGVPSIKRSPEGPLPAHLQRLETALDQILQHIRSFMTSSDTYQKSLQTCLEPSLALYDNLDDLLQEAGVKGKKANRARENFAWNVRIIRGQIDRLALNIERSRVALEQVESTRTTLQSFSRRDRSPSVRDKPRLTVSNRHHTTDNLSNYGSLGRSPSCSSTHGPTPPPVTDPSKLLKPKSILKKSNSNIESPVTYLMEKEDTPDYLGEYFGEECSGSSGEDEPDGGLVIGSLPQTR